MEFQAALHGLALKESDSEPAEKPKKKFSSNADFEAQFMGSGFKIE